MSKQSSSTVYLQSERRNNCGPEVTGGTRYRTHPPSTSTNRMDIDSEKYSLLSTYGDLQSEIYTSSALLKKNVCPTRLTNLTWHLCYLCFTRKASCKVTDHYIVNLTEEVHNESKTSTEISASFLVIHFAAAIFTYVFITVMAFTCPQTLHEGGHSSYTFVSIDSGAFWWEKDCYKVVVSLNFVSFILSHAIQPERVDRHICTSSTQCTATVNKNHSGHSRLWKGWELSVKHG